MYLINVTEFDLMNSLHLRDVLPKPSRPIAMTAGETTEYIVLCQGAAILETRFRYPRLAQFHAHQSEFAELGWMGMFEAVGARRDT